MKSFKEFKISFWINFSKITFKGWLCYFEI